MTNRNLSEVGARLEKAAEHFPHEATTLERYLLYEELAIAILDSEYMGFDEGALEGYLQKYLADQRKSLNIRDDDLT